MNEVKILSSRVVYDGGHIKVHEDRVIEPAGHECTREIVVHPGAVCIVARPSPDQVILIRQYRYATRSELVELPAGTLHHRRARFWTTPGFTTEFMYLFEASDLTKTQINPDDDEVIEVDIVGRNEALQMIDDGRVQDAKSILGLLRVLR
jgi:ADP-ribose pyrophosphatase